MKQKILRFYEKARDNIFIMLLYILLFFAVLGIGGYLLRFNPIMKFLGIIVIWADFYFLLYFPTFKRDR